LIKLRIDVDYPYPSRIRSFIYTALGIGMGSDYLKNSKILAKMINESPKQVKAYWFFTSKTIPDRELLELLDEDRHEVALHIANKPYEELRLLRKSTGRKVRYYTVHGTARFFARIMWKRWKAKTPKIPENYPLQSFYEYPTLDLDVLCHRCNTEKALEIANAHLEKEDVLHFHPIWLFQRGRMNDRGPYYETLRAILKVDNELQRLVIRKKAFFKMATDVREYERSVIPTKEFLEKIRLRGADIFTFIERKWCCPIANPPDSWVKTTDNIALLTITTYHEWLKSVGKKTRNMIRKAEKSGIRTAEAEPDDKLAEGIWKIYNETPIRQERSFPHYGVSLEAVKTGVLSPRNCTYIGAYYQDELTGFVQLDHGDNLTVMSQILSLQKHWDKAINNALVAKAVEVCASKNIKWLMYGRMGNHPTLDNFKQNNGCVKFELTRYYVPLTRKGKIATRLGAHREMKDALPQSIKYRLIPVYNWISRTRVRIKLGSKQKL